MSNPVWPIVANVFTGTCFTVLGATGIVEFSRLFLWAGGMILGVALMMIVRAA